MKKMFGLNCYRYTYSVAGEYGDEMFNGVLLSKNIHRAKKDAQAVCNKRKAKLVSVEKA